MTNKNSKNNETSLRPTRQEQEAASETVTELSKGVYRLQLPVFMPGLGHVNCYALEDNQGITLVDPGLPDQDSWNALGKGLKQLEARFDNVHTAISTHSHADHYGGVHRLRTEYETQLITHSSFSPTVGIHSIWEDLDSSSLDLADDKDIEKFRETIDHITPWGNKREGPPVEVIRSWGDKNTLRGYQVPNPSKTLENGQEIELGNRTWVAVHTPGHTHDHLCLYEPTDGLFLSGDHVLPTITPHISGMSGLYDPLATFFNSLELMKELDGIELVLPAHGHPFSNLASRSESIIRHHKERLQTIREAGAELGEAPVEKFMKRLFKERSWGDMAASETYAHLEHLRILGEASQSESNGIKNYLII